MCAQLRIGRSTSSSVSSIQLPVVPTSPRHSDDSQATPMRQHGNQTTKQVRKSANAHAGKPAFLQANPTLSGLRTNGRVHYSSYKSSAFPLKRSPSSHLRVLRQVSDACTIMDGQTQIGPPDYPNDFFGFTDDTEVLHDHNPNVDLHPFLEAQSTEADERTIIPYVSNDDSDLLRLHRISPHTFLMATLTTRCRTSN
jgi:hypothetical protein